MYVGRRQTNRSLSSGGFGLNNVTVTYSLTLGAGEAGDIVICADGATYATSSNAIKCTASRALNTIVLNKKVADAETGLIDTAFTYSAGKDLIVIKDANNKVNVFYNNAKVDVEQTVSDASVISNIMHYTAGDGSGAFTVKRYGIVSTIGSDTMAADNTGNWTETGGSSLAFDTDHYEFTGDNNEKFYRQYGVVVGNVYKISIDNKDGTAASIDFRIRFWDSAETIQLTTTTATWATHSLYIICRGSTNAYFDILLKETTDPNNIEYKNFKVELIDR